MTLRGCLLLAGGLASTTVCLAPNLAAQRVSGRVIDTRDSSGVAGALVALVDSGGRMLARWATQTDGTYDLTAPCPGRFALWVLRIGKRPWRLEEVVLDSGVTITVTLAVPDEPLQLPPIVVDARSRCLLNPRDTTLVGALLLEAEKALALAQATVDADRLHYLVETWEYRRWWWNETTDSVTRTAVGHGWPVRSLPAESLRVVGFVETDDATGNPVYGATYYGPDANVLFAPWFLESHCFRVARTSARDSLVAVEFEPAGRGRLVDVAGRLVLSRATLELRRLEFRWVGLPRWIPGRQAGGLIRFRRLQSGAWLPIEWRLRAPLPNARYSPPRVDGWVEFGGEAVGIR